MSYHAKYTNKKDIIYLQYLDNTHLALTLLFHLILTIWVGYNQEKGACILYWVTTDNSNYDFDVKVRSCRFVDFVNNVDVIDYGYLKCIFCFRIKNKEKYTFYINFYSVIFLLAWILRGVTFL